MYAPAAYSLPMRRKSTRSVLFLAAFLCTSVAAFVPSNFVIYRHRTTTSILEPQWSAARKIPLRKAQKSSVEGPLLTETCWNPKLRRTMGMIAAAGVFETGYLTISKLVGASDICGTSGSCSTILNGPYAYIPSTGIPLSLLGFFAYSVVAFLALDPIFGEGDDDDSWNRIFLATTSTVMGTFSVFLMYLLFGVAHESCPFCVASAVFSIVLMKLTWLGGVVPKEKFTLGVQLSTGGVLSAVAFSMILLSSVDESTAAVATNFAGTPTTLLASQKSEQLFSPPRIETESSPRALSLAKDLEALNAKMYGAYWCSHCFDQKQQFGKQAFAKITYLECAKDGMDSQSKICKARDVPGYPTWEINGKLFPGEQALDELEEVVQQFKSSQSKS